MLLTQLLSASSLAVPVRHSTYISYSDPNRPYVSNDHNDIPRGYTLKEHHQSVKHTQQQTASVETGNNLVYPYQRLQQHLPHQEIVRHRKTESYTTVVNSNTITTGNDVGVNHQASPLGGILEMLPVLPVDEAQVAKRKGTIRTKSMSRSKSRHLESFDRKVIISRKDERKEVRIQGGGRSSSQTTVSKNFTNVMSLDTNNDTWPLKTLGLNFHPTVRGLQDNRREGTFHRNNDARISSNRNKVIVFSSSDPSNQNVLKDARTSASVNVRVESARDPYVFTSSVGVEVKRDSAVNDRLENGNYDMNSNGINVKEIRVHMNDFGVNSVAGVNSTSGQIEYARAVVNGRASDEVRGDSTTSQFANLNVVSASSSSSSVGTEHSADFWNNYGYKFALVTTVGLIGVLAFIGVIRCLRSTSDAETGQITLAGRGDSNNDSSSTINSGGGRSGRGLRSPGLVLSTSLQSEHVDQTHLNASNQPHFASMLSVQSPGYAGMERLGVPSRSTTNTSSQTAAANKSSVATASSSAAEMVRLHHHHTLVAAAAAAVAAAHTSTSDHDEDDSSVISRTGTSTRRMRLGHPQQRECLRTGGGVVGNNPIISCNRNGNCNADDCCNDVKLYVALQGSSSAAVGIVEDGDRGMVSAGRSRMASDINKGRFPNQIRVGPASGVEWRGYSDQQHPHRHHSNQHHARLGSHTGCPYQAELTRPYIKPPPNKTALDVPDRDNFPRGGGAVSSAMSSRNSSSNFLNFPFVHGISASQEEVLSSGCGAGGGGAGVSKSTSKQSNFTFSRFFKARASNFSINNITNSNGSQSGTKSRPDSPCRYTVLTPSRGSCKSTSAEDGAEQRQPQHPKMSPSYFSVSLASTVNAASDYDQPQASLSAYSPPQHQQPEMVLDIERTRSTKYCVYMGLETTGSRYQSTTIETGIKETHQPSNTAQCDTREIDLRRSGETGAAAAAAAVGASVARDPDSDNIQSSRCSHSRNSHLKSDGQSIINIREAGCLQAQQQQNIHQSVSDGEKCDGSGGLKSASYSGASFDKRVFVEKRIKTSDPEADAVAVEEPSGSAGFRGRMDTE